MADVNVHTENWQTLPWRKIERGVRRLQQRIYRAERCGEHKRVQSLQRLLLQSWSARCLAVRRVSQDNRGKRTPGIDGVASLTDKQRLKMVDELRNLKDWTTDPIRRTCIPKPGTTEQRGLGIPTMRERAMQTLVKMALEPEWEAKFEPNSYGFRPGRSIHDAIGAIFNHICKRPKYVLDADIEKCFDRIEHEALLEKLNTIQPIKRLIRAWLKAGIVDKNRMLFPEAGTPQGSTISPLLCNVALHGFEQNLKSVSKRYRIAIIRYADDFVALCEDLETLLKVKQQAETWLAEMGLQLKPSKTRVTHTLKEHEGQVGFDFLGFNVRQYHVGKHRTSTYKARPGFKTLIKPSRKACKRHLQKVRQIIQRHRGAPQKALIAALNPVIRGWAQNYKTCVAKRTFTRMDTQMFHKLYRWARYRHPNKTGGWCYCRYWKRRGKRTRFGDKTGWIAYYEEMPIKRHIKVKGDKSPYDGDWLYWVQRLGRDPTKSTRVIKLLKRDKGRCLMCGLRFKAEDVIEIHHRDGDRNNNRYINLSLLHGHCHDEIHSSSVYDKDLCDRGAA